MNETQRENVRKAVDQFVESYVVIGLEDEAYEKLGEIVRLATFRRRGE